MGNLLTASKVKKLLKTPGRHCDGQGLWLFVSSAERGSWIYRYSANGKQHDMGLGSARNGDVSLLEARNRAGEARRIRAAGGDPLADRADQEAKAKLKASRARTFRDVAESYIAAHEHEWRNPKHRQQWKNTLATYVYPTIGHLSVQTVSTPQISDLLQPIWKTKRETARRVRARIEIILDAAKAAGMREGDNPARLRGNLDLLLGKAPRQTQVRHHPSLAYQDVPGFLVKLRAADGSAALALQWVIFTVARTSQAIFARGAEIDRRRGIWSVPGSRMKSGRDHDVPLSTAALAVLERLPKGAGTLFVGPGGKSLSDAAMRAVLQRLGYGHVTTHGFRASFKDWVRVTRPHDREAAELSLAHAFGDATEQAYVRDTLLERRRDLLQAWGKYCLSAAAPPNIIPIRLAVADSA